MSKLLCPPPIHFCRTPTFLLVCCLGPGRLICQGREKNIIGCRCECHLWIRWMSPVNQKTRFECEWDIWSGYDTWIIGSYLNRMIPSSWDDICHIWMGIKFNILIFIFSVQVCSFTQGSCRIKTITVRKYKQIFFSHIQKLSLRNDWMFDWGSYDTFGDKWIFLLFQWIYKKNLSDLK